MLACGERGGSPCESRRDAEARSKQARGGGGGAPHPELLPCRSYLVSLRVCVETNIRVAHALLALFKTEGESCAATKSFRPPEKNRGHHLSSPTHFVSLTSSPPTRLPSLSSSDLYLASPSKASPARTSSHSAPFHRALSPLFPPLWSLSVLSPPAALFIITRP